MQFSEYAKTASERALQARQRARDEEMIASAVAQFGATAHELVHVLSKIAVGSVQPGESWSIDSSWQVAPLNGARAALFAVVIGDVMLLAQFHANGGSSLFVLRSCIECDRPWPVQFAHATLMSGDLTELGRALSRRDVFCDEHGPF